MTIRSMMPNKNWYDNYENIFKKKEEVTVVPYLQPMFLYCMDGNWSQPVALSPYIENEDAFRCNLYEVRQVRYKDTLTECGEILAFEIHIIEDRGSDPLHTEILELTDALEFCSNYGGAHHHGR
jgi:hypothetical protein